MLLRFIRDTLIFIVTLIGVSFWYRRQISKQGPLVRVLAFHDVAERAWFAQLIARLDAHVHFITPTDFFNQDFDAKKINVLLTFDDGYASWISAVLPVLEQYRIQGLFFVSSGLVTVSDDEAAAQAFCRDQLQRSYRPIIDWEGVRTLRRAGQVIGGHSLSHRDLTTLTPDEVRHELEADKSRLESELGEPITDFAYPFGTRSHYNETIIRAVAESGYDRAFTAESGFVRTSDFATHYSFPRLCIENIATPASVWCWAQGGYDIVGQIKQVIWQKKHSQMNT